MTSQRIVIDTNVLISRLLVPQSTAAKAVSAVVSHNQLLVSDAMMAELADVLGRKKFDPYITVHERQDFLRLLGHVAEHVLIDCQVNACRDVKDNMVLELAVSGNAACVISGDADLLVLGSFREIPLLSPAEYLRRQQ